MALDGIGSFGLITKEEKNTENSYYGRFDDWFYVLIWLVDWDRKIGSKLLEAQMHISFLQRTRKRHWHSIVNERIYCYSKSCVWSCWYVAAPEWIGEPLFSSLRSCSLSFCQRRLYHCNSRSSWRYLHDRLSMWPHQMLVTQLNPNRWPRQVYKCNGPPPPHPWWWHRHPEKVRAQLPTWRCLSITAKTH